MPRLQVDHHGGVAARTVDALDGAQAVLIVVDAIAHGQLQGLPLRSVTFFWPSRPRPCRQACGRKPVELPRTRHQSRCRWS